MVGTYQFKLKNNQSNEEIIFYHGTNVSETISTNSISFALPNQTAEENLNLNLGGFNKILSLSFILQDRGSTVSTNAGVSIVTLSEQWAYIMDEWADPGTELIPGIIQGASSGEFNAQSLYTVTIAYKDSDGSTSTRAYIGMIDDISIEPVEGETRLRGRLNLKIGGTNPTA